MSLGIGAPRVGGGPSYSGTAGRYPWQPCKREPSPEAAANWHRHTENKVSVEDTYQTLYLPIRTDHERAGRVGARLRYDPLKQSTGNGW